MKVSADAGYHWEQNAPSTKTSHIRSWCWHRQKRQFVGFIGRHVGDEERLSLVEGTSGKVKNECECDAA